MQNIARIPKVWKPTTSPMGLGNLYSPKINYYMEIGETRCPRMLFRYEIGQEIKKWKQKSKIFILIMDANKDMNKVKLARSLTELVMQYLVK